MKKKTGVVILISDKADFRENITRGKEGNLIMTIHQDDIIILTICVSHNWASKYMMQKVIELQGVIDKSITIVWDFKTSFSITNRRSK